MSRLIDCNVVAEKISFSPTTIINWAYGRKPAPAGFPSPRKISNRLLWVESDIDSWIDALSIYPKEASTAAGLPTLDVQPDTYEDARALVTQKRGRGRPRKSGIHRKGGAA